MDCSPPGSLVHRILQERILEWVAIPFSRGSSQPRRSNPGLPHCRHSLPSEPPGKQISDMKWSEVKWIEVAQSCPTVCDPMDCSLLGSSVHGIFQARILEWVAIYFSRGTSQPRDQTRVSCIAGRCFTIWATREGTISGIDNTILTHIKLLFIDKMLINIPSWIIKIMFIFVLN